MKVDLVPFELVKKLVEKGFNEPTLFQYDNTGKLTDIIVEEGYRAPEIWLVLKWLREKNIHLYTNYHFGDYWVFKVTCLRTGYRIDTERLDIVQFSYLESILEGINWIIDNLL